MHASTNDRVFATSMMLSRSLRLVAISAFCVLAGCALDSLAAAPTDTEEASGQSRRLPFIPPGAAGFSVRHWTVADGLPSQSITSLAQTPDGYLWCSTTDGLVRYDGRRFKVYLSDDIPALEGLYVSYLYCDGGGRLWIFDSRRKIAVLEDGKFRRIDDDDGLPGGLGSAVITSGGGDCWVMGDTQDEFYRYRDGRFNQHLVRGLSAETDDSPEGRWRMTVGWADAEGLRWAIMDGPLLVAEDGDKSFNRRLVRIFEGHHEEVTVQGRNEHFEPTAFFNLEDETAALIARDGIYVPDGDNWKILHKLTPPIQKSHGYPFAGCQGDRGSFWLGCYYGGLVSTSAKGATGQFKLPEEERRPNISSVLRDASGGVWVASADGLYQIRSRIMKSFTLDEGLPESGINAVASDSGDGAWIAFDESVASIGGGGTIEDRFTAPLDYRVHGVMIEQLSQGAGGILWVALRRFSKFEQKWKFELWHGSGTDFDRATPIEGGITALYAARGGQVVIGTPTGLKTWQNGSLDKVDLPGTDTDRVVSSIIEDGDGRLLAGVRDVGLFRFENGSWHLVVEEEKTGFRAIQTLCADADGNVWAACGEDGLALWRGSQLHTFEGLGSQLPRRVTAAQTDDHGGLWLASDSGEGLVRFDREGLLRWISDPDTTVTGTRFGRDDGLPSLILHSLGNPMVKDPTGRIWVSTSLGAAVIDPSKERFQLVEESPPITVLQQVSVNDTTVIEYTSGMSPSSPAEEIVIPPGRRRIEFQFSATELASPDNVHYRYRLEGFDDRWINAEKRTGAIYPDLPPGEFTFRVASATGNGGWGKPTAPLVLRVEPRWLERTTTRVLLAMSVVVALVAAFAIKLRQIRSGTRLQEEFSRTLIDSQESERRRLADDLHDSLGHDLLVLKRELEVRSQQADGESGERLELLSDKTGRIIEQVRDISQNLHPPELARFGLGSSLKAIGRSTEEATGIHIYTDIRLTERLDSNIELGLFRIAQEALSNLAKHSDASEGNLSLDRADDQIRLVIQDDGRGFDPAEIDRSTQSAGRGLENIRQRTRLLGGSVDFRTRKAQGCQITVSLPCPSTYS